MRQNFCLVPELRDVTLLGSDGYVVATIVLRPVLYGELQGWPPWDTIRNTSGSGCCWMTRV